MIRQVLRILMITSEWPTSEHPERGNFIVRQVKFLREAGIDVDVFAFRGAKNLLNYFKAWFRLQKQLRNNCYHLIHAQFGQSGLLVFPKRLPFVITFHGSDLEGIVGRRGEYTVIGQVLRLISKLVSLHADVVIVVSKSLVKYLPKKCTYYVIPVGVDFELFRPIPKVEARKMLGFQEEKKLILFGGNPNMPVKRYSLALQAVEILNSRLNVEIIPLQGIPPKLVPIYMNACDVLLLTSF
ncbi:MAG: glycosyltransferase, partial [Candidatus Omnitrophica bacterium]|nr:glycosyltransferase [Candidatus Omnitrophota bacterium]